MGRAIANTSCVVVAMFLACAPRPRTCAEGCVNGAVCDSATQLCVQAGSDDQRYERIDLVAPPRAGANPVTLTAELVLRPGATRADPPFLVLTVDGGTLRDDAGMAVRSMLLLNAGRYRAQGTFPAVEGPRELYVTLPDGALAATATTYVDLTPPTAIVELASPPVRISADDGGLNEVDPDAPGAWRRDEIITVNVDTSEKTVSSAMVSLLSDGGSQQALATADGGCISRFDGGVCQQARLELWRHPMRTYRERVAIIAHVTDDIGNARTVDAGHIAVTRFKWLRDAPGPTSNLAITRDGNLAIAVNSPGRGIVVWKPDGTELWSRLDAGDQTQVATGAHFDEHLYSVSFVDSNFNSAAVATPTGNPAMPISPLFAPLTATLSMGPPVVVTNGSQEIVWFVTSRASNQLTVQGWRLQDQSTAELDAGSGFLPAWIPFSDNNSIYVPVSTGAYASNVLRIGSLPGGLDPILFPELSIPGDVSSAAVAQTDLMYFGVGLSDGGGALMSASRTAVNPQTVPLPIAAPYIIIGSSSVFASDLNAAPGSVSSLCSVPIGGSSITCAALNTRSGIILGAPAVEGGASIIYAGARQSAVESFIRAVDSSTLTVLWETPVPSFNLPYSIDCSRTAGGEARPGAPGVLYSITFENPDHVRATIVDSPGIDFSARWPMFGHDPRATNNSQMPLSTFYCP